MSKIAPRLPSSNARVTQAGAQALEARLHKLDDQIKTAKAAVSKQAKMMTLSRFTPEGYKKALAHLHALQKHEKTLEQSRAKLIELMTRI